MKRTEDEWEMVDYFLLKKKLIPTTVFQCAVFVTIILFCSFLAVTLPENNYSQ